MIINEKQTLVMKSTPSSLRQVELFVDEICDYFNIHNDYFGNILMSVTEAVKNAIIHGNQNDENKKVTLEFKPQNGMICFTVSDEGYGFDPNSVTDPTDPESNPEQGRGLFVMKSLTDEINFLNNGSTVELCFKIANINNKLATQRLEELEKHFEQVKTKNEVNKEQ